MTRSQVLTYCISGHTPAHTHACTHMGHGETGTHGSGRGGEGGECEDSQSGCKEAAFVFGLLRNINGFDEVHIQDAPLQEPDGF